jgi:hypothetical protein
MTSCKKWTSGHLISSKSHISYNSHKYVHLYGGSRSKIFCWSRYEYQSTIQPPFLPFPVLHSQKVDNRARSSSIIDEAAREEQRSLACRALVAAGYRLSLRRTRGSRSTSGSVPLSRFTTVENIAYPPSLSRATEEHTHVSRKHASSTSVRHTGRYDASISDNRRARALPFVLTTLCKSRD